MANCHVLSPDVITTRQLVTALFKKSFEFGDRVEVLDAARGALDLDETLQSDAPAGHPESGNDNRIRQQLFVSSRSRNFTKKVDWTKCRYQREVEAAPKRFGIPRKGQTRRSAAKIRFVRLKPFRQAGQIFRGAPVDDIDVQRQSGRSMDRCGGPS